LCFSKVWSQGNKLSIRSTSPKDMSICGSTDTARITVYNISSSVISAGDITLILPPGVNYIAGSLNSSTVTESNLSNLNKPIFKSSKLLLAQYYNFRVRLKADCKLLYKLGGSYQPQIDIRVDYSGNYDLGSSLPFAPNVPSPVLSNITNRSYTGDVGGTFIRTYTIKNFGKGPLQELYFYRLNGSDLSTQVQKEFSSVQSGDSLITRITKSLISAVGNKDSFLDKNESIVFSDTISINGCKSLNTKFFLIWGCNSQLCQIIKNNGSVNISNKAPNIKTWAYPTSSTCPVNSVGNTQELVITNIGQLTALKSEIDIYQTYGNTTGFYKNMYSRIDTSSVFIRYGKIGKKSRTYPIAVQNNYSYTCLGNNPIGSMTLAFGDLKPGDTIYINWDMFKCAPTNCGSSFYNEGWAYQVHYFDVCGDKNSTIRSSGKWGVLSRTSLAIDAPTDIASGITENLKYTFGSTYFLPMHSSGKIYMDLILPKTLKHSLSINDFYINNYRLTSTWYPDSVIRYGDTIRGYFGNRVKMNITNGELYIKVKGDCSNSKKNESLPITLQIKCNPDTRCTPSTWINMACKTYYVKVHCDFNCSGGMRFKNFSVKRINFGLPDNNSDGLPDGSGTLDTSKLRTERAMYGDTVMASFFGRPKSAGGSNTTWRNGFAQSIVSFGKFLEVIDAELIVIKGSTVQSSGCTSVRHKKTISGNNAVFDFNFSVDSIYSGGCLSSSYRYGQNDSLILQVRYRIAENLSGNNVNVLFRNRFYLSNNANPTLAQSYQCDTFNGSFSYLGYYFTNYGADNRNYGTCGPLSISQSFYLGIGRCCSNYSGNDAFPFEYRNWATIDKLRVHLPKGLDLISAHFYQYRTTGRGASVRENVLNITPVAGSNNPIVFDLKKLHKANGGVINASDDGFNGFVNFRLQPRCDFESGVSQLIDYDYIFEKHNAMGTGFDTMFSNKIGTSDRITFNKPKISLTPTIQTVYANTDTAEWELRYVNASNSFQAYQVWIAQKKNNNIKVVEVWDLDNDTLIKPVNDIYRSGPLGVGKVRRFKIRATYNSCAPDSLILYGAWACDGYPTSLSSFSCIPDKTTLYLEPKNTRLQLTIKDSSDLLDLCAGNRMEILLENIQDVNSFSNKLQLVLPIGMEIIQGSVELQYPVNKAPSSFSMPTILSGTTVQWDLDKLISGLSKGFSGTSDTSLNKLKVVFRTTTNCNYASGSYVIAKAQANINCGDPVLVIPAYSRPLDIVGITRPYYTLAELKSDSILPCTKPFKVFFKSIILGPSKTKAKDRIEVLLPEGMSWDSSYFVQIRNAPIKDSFTITNINGAKLISWLLPADVEPGDSIEFETKFNAESNKFFCGTTDISVRTVVVQSALCVSTNIYCDIKVVTGGELISPIVDKASLTLTPFGSYSYMIKGDSEQVYLSYEMSNNGQDLSANEPIIINFFFDKNSNGKWDVGDKYLSTDTIKKALKSTEKVALSKAMRISAGESCGILAVIDSSACSCIYGQLAFPTPQLRNAGRDTAICSGSNLSLGGSSRYTFSYSWNNASVLTNTTKARTSFIAENQSGKPELYKIVLSTNRGTCFSRDTVAVIVNPLPKLSIGLKDTQLCKGSWLNLNPNVASGVAPFNYEWKSSSPLIDSSLKDLLIKPDSHTYFYLYVDDNNGCVDADSTDIKVYNRPKAKFTFPIACANQPLVVTNNSDKGTLNWNKIVWSTGTWDTVQVEKTPIPMLGLNEVVQLIVTNDANCSDTIQKPVSKKAIPKAAFSIENHCLNSSYQIGNTSSSDSGVIKEYLWDFNDGSNSSDSLPVHLFKSADTFNVSLLIKSEFGCEDSIKKLILVHPIPQANFTFNKPCENQNLVLVNTSTLSSGAIASINWSNKYGQKQTDSLVLLLNSYDSFMTKLVVISDYSCMDSIEKRVRVFDNPIANFNAKNVCDGNSVQFIDSANIDDGILASHTWNFGDGNFSNLSDPTHLYSTEGNYSVTQKVISNFGCEDSIQKLIKVHPLLNASIVTSDHCFGLNQDFSLNFTGNGILDSLKWQLGNSDLQSNAAFNYTYPKVGSYTVELDIITKEGCLTKTSKNLAVHPLPVFNSILSENECSDEKVKFETNVGVESGSISSTEWIFKDNFRISGAAVSRSFTIPTNSTVAVVSSTDKGCIDSTQVAFQSYEKAVPSFTVNEVCLDEPSLFKDLSTAYLPISEYRWDLGDGTSGMGKNFTHTYNSSGVFNCTHTIVTKIGCEYTIMEQSTVNPKPIPGLGLDPKRSIITEARITISDLSSGADSVWYRYENSKINRNRNFVHRFPDSGYYKIHQYVLNSYGCMDSTSDDVYIDFIYTLFIPNAFTPNDKPPNNIFKPDGLGHVNYELLIYDQWGGLIYKGTNGGWDGTSGGEAVPDGVYAYLIVIKDYENDMHYHRGILHLLR